MITPKQLKIGFLVLALAVTAWPAGRDHKLTDPEPKYGAYEPVRKPLVPAVKHRAWVKTKVDAFILSELESKHIAPSPPADRIALIRRATFDLTGLPPTTEEVKAFLKDKSPNAFERVIDRLLSSPHYGEKWARHWLDLARYAGSAGFKADEPLPNTWCYGDYVIKSLKKEKPCARFTKERRAGDELWPGSPAGLVATGLTRHYPDESNARNLRQRRQEILNDITDTVGAVF